MFLKAFCCLGLLTGSLSAWAANIGFLGIYPFIKYRKNFFFLILILFF